MGLTRGTLVLQGDADRGFRAGVYLGEDPDGTGIWAPFATVEKIEPGDFESHPDTFADAINSGTQQPAAVVGAPTVVVQSAVHNADGTTTFAYTDGSTSTHAADGTLVADSANTGAPLTGPSLVQGQ